MKPCRICRSPRVTEVGYYRPYKEFGFTVYDCGKCGCRFVWRQEKIFEALHSGAQSPYAFHKEMADRVKQWFDRGDLGAMYAYLSRQPKNRFVMDAIARLGCGPKQVLEIGCSWGYLAAYHLLAGYRVLAVDISTTAVVEAALRFGPHFRVVEDDDFARLGTFEVAYHLGTIGCVDDPVGFTRNILQALRPGGKLFFNAPNVAAAREMKALWVSGTPPPDLITLFCESFWQQAFAAEADVEVCYEPYDGIANLRKFLDRIRPRPYILDRPDLSLTQAGAKPRYRPGSPLRQGLAGVAKFTGSRILPRQTLEYGMFVTLTKK